MLIKTIVLNTDIRAKQSLNRMLLELPMSISFITVVYFIPIPGTVTDTHPLMVEFE